MRRKATLTEATDSDAHRLLERHGCPTPFHAVRTHFLGNIASPEVSVSPVRAVQRIWDGELPELESEAAVQELMDVLVAGLWNRLTRHQSRKSPFHLTRMNLPRDGAELGRYARVRQEEIEGFVHGLFGEREELELPERAHRALDALADIRSFLVGYVRFSDDPDIEESLNDTVRKLAELSRIAEREMNEVVVSCTRARRQALETVISEKPPLH